MSISARKMSDNGDLPAVMAIVGPTASGKSALAAAVAATVGGEIVNADSMQCYRGMDIGTAKPSAAERSALPHHLFDIVAPDEDFTAAAYSRLAREVIRDIHSRGKIPVVVGGTGLYIRALLSGLAESPGADNLAREEYTGIAERDGNEALHRLLCAVDPLAAARIHPNNRVRIIRALEVFRQTGRSITEFQQQHRFGLQWCNYLKIAISVDRKLLYERIDQRVDRMIIEGLVAEVEALLAAGYPASLKSLSAIGYREVCAFLAGSQSLPETVELIKRNSRRYAKRQLTWFNNENDVLWFSQPLVFEDIMKVIDEFLSLDISHRPGC